MNLEKAWLSFVKKHNLWDKESHVLVALSGGVDSIVLTHLLTRLPQEIKPKISVAHINHQLRQESNIEASYIRELTKNLKITLYLHTWEKDKQPATNVEASAREMRYDYFEKIMEEQNIPVLLTAHHLGDQAETVLMKLLRGGLLEDKVGIHLISNFRGKELIRPLLPFSKEELYEYAEKKQLKYFEDETNYTNMYLRNRIRRNILPLLKEENPQVEHHFNEFSQELSDVLDFARPLIKQKKADFFAEGTLHLDEFQKEKDYTQRLILEEILKEVFSNDKSFNKNYIDLLFEWLYDSSPNSSLQLASGIIAQKAYNIVVFKKETEGSAAEKDYQLELNSWIKLSDGSKIGLFKESEVDIQKEDLVFPISKEEIKLPITVRHRRNGDRMSLKGEGGSKKIKDIFIDQKIPLHKRDSAWLLEDANDRVIWLVGYKESQLFNNSITDKINYSFIFRK